ncbi:MAG: hypothetical protein ACFKPT_22270 [Gloeotrichia echinulata GP01]
MGLTQVIRRLAIPREQEPLPLVLIHAMAPALNVAGRNEDLGIFRKTAYDIFKENYYFEDETVPNENDQNEPFTPFVLPFDDKLRGDIALFSRDNSPEEVSRLEGLVTLMTSKSYQNLAERLCRLFGRELKKQQR